jgi:PPOX class probable F420-dependent enzyme
VLEIGILIVLVALSKHVLSRLNKEIVAWLATTNPNGGPLVVPVWFFFDGKTFLIYSVPGQKVRNIERNPLVALHLNSNAEGGDVVRVAAKAQLLKRQPPAYKVPAYLRKYRPLIKSYGWTPESFSADYRIPIRVRPTKFQGE